MIKKIVIGLILLLIGIVAFLVVDSLNKKMNYITDSDYLYDMAIQYLINKDDEESNPDHEKDGYHFFATYEKLGIIENNNQKYVYMWVLGESYYLDEGVSKNLSGYSIFHKFVFENDAIVTVEVPKDGSYYSESVKELCYDKKMAKRVLNHNFSLSLKDQVNRYYGKKKRDIEE